MTAHVDVGDGPALTGAQVRDEIVATPLTATDVDREVPLNVAVMFAVWSVALAATLAVNVAVAAFEATETEAGTVTEGLLLESITVPPPDFDIVIVQVLDWAGPKLVGLQASEETVNRALTDNDTERDTPLKEAEMLTAKSPASTPTAAVNDAEALPAGIVNEAGTVTDALLLERATVPPVVFESVTVQLVEELLVNVVFAHVTLLIVTAVTKATDADCEDPFKDAVILAL